MAKPIARSCAREHLAPRWYIGALPVALLALAASLFAATLRDSSKKMSACAGLPATALCAAFAGDDSTVDESPPLDSHCCVSNSVAMNMRVGAAAPPTSRSVGYRARSLLLHAPKQSPPSLR